MKALILLLLSLNAYSDDFTYDNGWCVIREESGNTKKSCTINEFLTKLPDSDCVMGRTTHVYNRKLKEDSFTRTVSCFNPEMDTVFKCNFDPNWKDSDGQPDETATTCTMKLPNGSVQMNINRYPSGKYKFKKEQKRIIESDKAI